MPGEGRGLSSRQRKTWRGTWRLGNLATPKSVQKLQTALHAKAKAEAGYRFCALYDKISRDDILAHAYAQCRSNRVQREETVRTLRTSRRMGPSDGWPNWRLRSGRRPTGRSQSDECLYRRPTANSGRWASRACGIGSA